MLNMMQNSITESRGSFETNLRDSFARQNMDPAKIQSLLGSMVNPNGSIIETLPQNLYVENSIEEYEDENDGLPDIDVY